MEPSRVLAELSRLYFTRAVRAPPEPHSELCSLPEADQDEIVVSSNAVLKAAEHELSCYADARWKLTLVPNLSGERISVRLTTQGNPLMAVTQHRHLDTRAE